MKTKNALKVRQELGAILDDMEASGAPIIIERRSKAIAALIPYEVFKERFIEQQSGAERARILERFRAALKPSDVSTLKALRELRYGKE